MNENRAVAYSLLAHIRNNKSLISGPLDIFSPLIKRAIQSLFDQEIIKSDNLNIIRDEALKLFGIDFPLPVIKEILHKIYLEEQVSVGSETLIQLYQDGAFYFEKFAFHDFQEEYHAAKIEITKLESTFQIFCESHDHKDVEPGTLVNFIERNKVILSRYLSGSRIEKPEDFSIHAEFVRFFRDIPEVFEVIRNLYLGAIISTYLEYEFVEMAIKMELVFDTNFIVSLLNLNTEESYSTCSRLLEWGKKLGCKLTILSITIEETKRLLFMKAESFDLHKKILVNPEDIYFACRRHGWGKSDLERFSDNLATLIQGMGISIIWNDEKYQKQALYSEEYSDLRVMRNSDFAARHDATVLSYVKEKRGKIKPKKFEDAVCWFVNNSSNFNLEDLNVFKSKQGWVQANSIRADILLSILWLARPEINGAKAGLDITAMGLSGLVASTLRVSSSKSKIIRELETNIERYANEDLTEEDYHLISTRVVHEQLEDLQHMNDIAGNNPREFNSTLHRLKEEERSHQKFIADRIANSMKNLSLETQKSQILQKKSLSEIAAAEERASEKTKELDEVRTAIEKDKELLRNEAAETRKEKERAELGEKNALMKSFEYYNSELEEKQQQIIKIRGDKYKKALWRWRKPYEYALIVFVGFSLVSGILSVSFEIKALGGLTAFIGIISAILIAIVVLKRFNHSNIQAFEKSTMEAILQANPDPVILSYDEWKRKYIDSDRK